MAVVSRTQSDLDAAAAEISASTGNEVVGIAADVKDESAVEAMV